jgi:DNA-binding transcriptional LysR family regulator
MSESSVSYLEVVVPGRRVADHGAIAHRGVLLEYSAKERRRNADPCAEERGLILHPEVRCAADERRHLERLCRTIAVRRSCTKGRQCTPSGIGISFFPTQFMRPWVERGLLVDLRSDPPLPDLEYCFLARKDDSRELVRRIKRYVIEEVDLSRDTNPFRDL